MKKILAAAIAAAIVPMAAAADTNNVTVYGKVHVSIDSNDTAAKDNYEVSSRSSRLGFKGTEDLGNGLKAIWQYEMTYDVTDGDAVTSARNSYVGLAGDFGTFLVGRHDTPAKVAFYAAGVEELGDSILDLNCKSASDCSPTNGIFYELRASNAIAYISPSFSGLTVAGAIVPGEQDGVTPGQTERDGIADSYSLAAMYGANGLKASLAYESLGVYSNTEEQSMWQAGVSYTMNAFKVGAMYQDISDMNGVADNDYTAWLLNATYTFGNNKVIGQYGETDADLMDDRTVWGLGLEHMFSKRTSVYAAYANNDPDGGDEDSQWSVGMIHNF